MSISQMLLPEFDEEMKNTRRLLECVPDGKFDYRPHPKSMTLGQLATHVAQMSTWAATTFDVELLEFGPDFKPPLANTRAELLDMFDLGVAKARQKLSAASDADWQKTWTLKFSGKTILAMPRTVVMRSTVMNHMIHHRAQLGVYLRLNEVAIPGMYGPSADEAHLWEAKGA